MIIIIYIKYIFFFQNGNLTMSRTEFLSAWLYWVMNALPVYLRAISSRTVRWEMREFTLKWYGNVEPAPKREQKSKKNQLTHNGSIY